jgi:hypothetical protein
VLLDHERAEELVELPEVAQADQLSVLEHEREHGVDPDVRMRIDRRGSPEQRQQRAGGRDRSAGPDCHPVSPGGLEPRANLLTREGSKDAPVQERGEGRSRDPIRQSTQINRPSRARTWA